MEEKRWCDSFVDSENSWMPFFYEQDLARVADHEDEKAPFVPVTQATLDALIPFLEVGLRRTDTKLRPDDVLLDLGCGDGRILVEALRAVPTCRAVGIDIDAAATARARANLERYGVAERATVLEGDFFGAALPWDDVTVVVLYLLPSVLDALFPLLRARMRADARLFCVCFTFQAETSFRVVRETAFPALYEIELV